MGERDFERTLRVYAQFVSAPDSNLVCGKCGAEVSAFVTECPYCGARLRQRAPELERRGDEITPKDSSQSEPPKVTHLRRRPRIRLPRIEFGRPWASILTVAASVILLLVAEAGDIGPVELGGIVGPVSGSEWWRYLVAPFVYDDVGYLFVCACGIMIFGISVESRVGTPVTALVILACGSLGLLLGIWVGDSLGAGDVVVAWGGNAVALGLLSAWAVIRAVEFRRESAGEVDLIGAAVCAAVLVLLSVVIEPASILVGISGALIGALIGVLLGLVSDRSGASRI